MRIKLITPSRPDEGDWAPIAATLFGGTTVDVVHIDAGVSNGESAAEQMALAAAVVAEGVGAAAEGYDGVCVDHVADVGVDALRSRLRIPVVGSGQAAVHLAALIGKKNTLLTGFAGRRQLGELWADGGGLARFPQSIRPVESGATSELAAAASDSVAGDAGHAIIIGECWMAESLPELRELAGSTVVTATAAALKVAEILVSLDVSHSEIAPGYNPSDPSLVASFDELLGQRLRAAGTRAGGTTLERPADPARAFSLKVIVPVQGLSEHELRALELEGGLRAPGTSVGYYSLHDSTDSADNAYDAFIMALLCFEEGLRAEAEGYDAVLTHSTTDSGIDALKSVLEISAIAPGEACWNLAALLGKRFSIIAMEDKWNHFFYSGTQKAGVWRRLASIVNIGVAPDPVLLFEGKEREMEEALERVSRAAIENDGADTFVIGSTTMQMAADYLAETLPAPVLSPGMVGLKVAEALGALGVSQSPRAYPRAAAFDAEAVFAPSSSKNQSYVVEA